ncbi:MAG: HTH domain-containing protein [Bacilli bacterium]|nr:HTH domain-containing protein [Bacilli bacterium]
MDKQIYITSLYDIYSNLLTEKQKKYFEDYYFENLSLKEISENYNVSRNAIHNSIKEVEEKLNYYENNLNIYEKIEKIKKIVTKIDNIQIKEEIENIL